MKRPRRRQQGAALLLAMIIVALIVTMAAGMVWMQSRAVTIEAAERARSQSAWILSGALDWARLILREDQRGSRQRGNVYDALTEPWATPLAEARLSTFLAADKDNNADGGPEAFISGSIVDAQSRFNVRGLVDGAGKVVPVQVSALQRLANLAGAPADTATRIAEALAHAQAAVGDEGPRGPPLRPTQLYDLSWQGIDRATLARLEPWIDLLPLPTPVNANTAPREVLVAAIDGLDLGSAERLVQTRLRKPFESLADIQAQLPQNVRAEGARVGVSSSWFIVAGRLRLEDRVVEERSLLQRDNDKVTVRRRERLNLSAGRSG